MDVDTKLIAIEILEDRGEQNESLLAMKIELDQKRNKLLTNKISVDRYNTFGDRFLANAIDGFVLRLFGFLIGLLIVPESTNSSKIILLITLLFPYLYTISFHGVTGQTIGKMLMGIKLFNKDEKEKISFKQAILRDIIPLGVTLVLYLLWVFGITNENEPLSFSSMFLMYILVIWSLLEIITLLFNEKRRALHDFIAGTVVLKIKE
jgi:uncharacterized RDD family membrane protein YckC